MMNRFIFSFLLVLMAFSASFSATVPSLPETNYPLIDESSSQPQARSLWQPMQDSKPVSVVNLAGANALKMPCNFRGTRIDRAYWDRKIKLDLTMSGGVQFLFYCSNLTPIGSFTIYFHSGEGWYAVNFTPAAESKWVPVKILRKSARSEGNPAGWGSIDTIRISAWRGRDVDTEFYLAALVLLESDAKIVILRGDSAKEKIPQEIKTVRQYTEIMSQFLDDTGLSHVVLSDLDLTAERLKKITLIILPHNPHMPDNVVQQIVEFIRRGGKLICCYHLPTSLQPVVGIRSGPHLKQKHEGYFASMRPADQSIDGLPSVTGQNSWNIMDAVIIEGRSRVAAWWYDSEGRSAGKPALVVSDNCAYLTHVLLDDDPENKRQMLLAIVNNLVPELLKEAAENIIKSTGQVEPYENFDDADKAIKKQIGDSSLVRISLDEASLLQKKLQETLSKGNFLEVIVDAQKAHDSLVKANYLAQEPLEGEHRAFWCHSAFGVAGMEWDEAIKLLGDNGFTAILPNMLWGGTAFYESEVLPVAPAVKERGDQIALCVAACKKYGIECHVWKVNFNMGWATSKEFIDRMKAQGRTQVRFDGSSFDRWLCPSHPENQKLEIDSMLEVARKYDVDGVHFDYIRYSDRDGCFCSGCRERFEKTINQKIENWPADLRRDNQLNDKWLDFRRQQITSVVSAVARQARKIRADIKISAAVFRDWPVDRNNIGQDWKLWCERGYLDFICPMDYTDNSQHFRGMLQRQLDWTGDVPCYPGIGLAVWPNPTDISKLIHQINITRELKTGGFTIFNYGPREAQQVLPLLGQGITRKK